MFALRSKKVEHGAGSGPDRDGNRYGAVSCPKCATVIQVVGWNLKLAEEFSVRCPACHCRSFHTRTAMASSGSAAKANG